MIWVENTLSRSLSTTIMKIEYLSGPLLGRLGRLGRAGLVVHQGTSQPRVLRRTVSTLLRRTAAVLNMQHCSGACAP
jgi:hypothetical protein